MAFTPVLKDMMLRGDGNAYVGQCASVTLPKLGRNFEEIRAAGMDRAVKVDMGGTPLEMETTFHAPMRDVLRQYGATTLAATALSYIGSYVDDETGGINTVEVYVRGRHEEIDFGESKPGEKGDFKVKSALVYYKLVWNGATEIEVDVLNMIEIVGGVDRLAERRAAIGL